MTQPAADQPGAERVHYRRVAGYAARKGLVPTDHPLLHEVTCPQTCTVTPELVVAVMAEELRGYISYRQFDRIASMHGFSTPALFAEFTTALSGVGIDYAERRAGESAREAELADLVAEGGAGPHLMLWSAATRAQFVVCRGDGGVIWRQRFDTLTPAQPVKSEVDAIRVGAQQAIWLAGQARQDWGARVATLHLIMARCRGQLIENLIQAACVAGLILDLEADAHHNPAAEQSGGAGAVDWRYVDLGSLIQHRIWP